MGGQALGKGKEVVKTLMSILIMSNLSINSCLRKYFYCFFNGTADSIWDRTAAASLASLSLKAQLIKRFGQMSSWAGEG